jgi:hypothetical protein
MSADSVPPVGTDPYSAAQMDGRVEAGGIAKAALYAPQ